MKRELLWLTVGLLATLQCASCSVAFSGLAYRYAICYVWIAVDCQPTVLTASCYNFAVPFHLILLPFALGPPTSHETLPSLLILPAICGFTP
jgi:hypothetical protein